MVGHTAQWGESGGNEAGEERWCLGVEHERWAWRRGGCVDGGELDERFDGGDAIEDAFDGETNVSADMPLFVEKVKRGCEEKDGACEE